MDEFSEFNDAPDVMAVFNQMVQCDDCIFWVEGDAQMGDCRRRSPTVVGGKRGVWPRTHKEDGCGDGELPLE